MQAEQRGEGLEALVGRTVLGCWRVEAQLAVGGMGAVFRVRHAREPGRVAALKVMMRVGERSSQRARERFEQEAVVAAAVGSHRVARPLDVGELEDGTPCILMEYVAGRNLAAALAERGALPVEEALGIAVRVADTVARAHAQGIVHRDLKPSNIMLADEAGRGLVVKLIDFGVAQATGALKVAHTGERALIGTLGYMAPEAAAAMPVDVRADVFSLGAVLHEMLAGAPPFAGASERDLVVATLTGTPAPIASRRPARLDPVPPAVESWVARALAKEPSQRPSMAELRDGLSSLLAPRGDGADRSFDRPLDGDAPVVADDHAVSSLLRHLHGKAAAPVEGPGSTTRSDVRPRRRRRWPWVAVATGLALATAALVARATRHAPPAVVPSLTSEPAAAALAAPASTKIVVVPAAPSEATATPHAKHRRPPSVRAQVAGETDPPKDSLE